MSEKALTLRKLNIGCGTNILKGYVNLDIVPLPGVDVACDLRQFPWPFKDERFDEIYMKDTLEHLSDTVKAMEEIYRITNPGGKVYIAVPYWNSWEAITDPTHVRQFNEYTFEFFDPSKWRCQNRPYYSSARFGIERQGYGVKLFAPDFPMRVLSRYRVIYDPFAKKLLSILANRFCNIIIGLELELTRL